MYVACHISRRSQKLNFLQLLRQVHCDSSRQYRQFLVATVANRAGRAKLSTLGSRVHTGNPPECATPIQLCVGSWSSGIGSSDVMRTLHTSARPVSRQGTIVFDPRVPATPRVPFRCVRYYDAKIRFRSTKQDPMQSWIRRCTLLGGGYVLLLECEQYFSTPGSKISPPGGLIETSAGSAAYKYLT